MTIAVTIDAMIAAGCTPEQLGAVVRAHSAREAAIAAERRAKSADRQRRYRSRDVTVTDSDSALHDATSRDSLPSSPPLSAPPMRDKTLPPHQSPTSPSNQSRAFERFWAIWPHKVGKPAAEKSFSKIVGEIGAILAGVERYIVEKPFDRPWLNPATFLNQRRWEDQPAQPSARASPNGHAAKPSALSVLMEIENGTRKPQSNDRPDIPFGSGAGPLIEGSAYEVRERDDPGWI